MALKAPDAVFAELPSVQGWRQDEDSGDVVAVADAKIAAPAITRALVAANADVLSIGESRHSLEDVYLVGGPTLPFVPGRASRRRAREPRNAEGALDHSL